MRPSSDTDARDNSGDEDEAPAISLKDLIASKFEHGVRSKYEEARQLEVKEARKRRKLGTKAESMKSEETAKILKADPGPSVVQSRCVFSTILTIQGSPVADGEWRNGAG